MALLWIFRVDETEIPMLYIDVYLVLNKQTNK